MSKSSGYFRDKSFNKTRKQFLFSTVKIFIVCCGGLIKTIADFKSSHSYQFQESIRLRKKITVQITS